MILFVKLLVGINGSMAGPFLVQLESPSYPDLLIIDYAVISRCRGSFQPMIVVGSQLTM